MSVFPASFVFSDEELDEHIAKARERFLGRVLDDMPAMFGPRLAAARVAVRSVMELTEDLRRMDPDRLAARPDAVVVLRYATAPPISEEDLKTVAGWPFNPTPNSRSVRVSAPRVAEAFEILVDRGRFPWLAEARPPDEQELRSAVEVTATLMAVERFRTERRGAASKEQEKVVRDVLERECGLREAPIPPRRPVGNIALISDLQPGTFTRECVLHGAKCDVPTRLPDGLLMPIECKVSNGQKNGWKRVSREVQGKAGTWRHEFGSSAIVIGVMLDGNFDRGTLRAFQEQGCFIFWQHDLQRLVDFVTSHTP